MLAQEQTTLPKPNKNPAPPDLPLEYKSKLQALVIQQKNIKADEEKLVAQFNADVERLKSVNEKGQAVELEALKKLNLDPEKYTTLEVEGDLKVILKPVPPARKK